MKLYYMAEAFDTGGDLLNMNDSKRRLFDFFLLNSGDGKFLKYTVPVLTAQEYFKLKDIKTADYLPMVTNIPVFSEKAKNIFVSVFQDEADYYECYVDCEGGAFKVLSL